MDEQTKDSSNNEQSSCQETQVVVVVMVPFPCQSHLNQLLQLSCLISSYRNTNNGATAMLQVHYACSATHIHQAKLRFSDKSLLQAANIHFHELPTPPFLSPSPNTKAASTTKFPVHLQPSFEASLHIRQPLAELLQKISATARRVIVVHDVLMAYAVQDTASIPNAETYGFNPTGIFSSFYNRWQLAGRPFETAEPEGLPSLDGCFTSEFLNLVAIQSEFLKCQAGTIYNTCRTIEGTYLDLKSNQDSNKKVWAIGPLNLAINNRESRKLIDSQHKCLEWLDKQAPRSVLYVSFGTTISLSNEQIKELALGLEESKQKFIWVLRDADKGDIFAADVEGQSAQLPKGFEERINEVGMVVRDWAPQLEILEHVSTGGFLSHCGWNSCMESMSMEVPIAAWPMHSDQPKNAFLVTDVLKVGVAVRRWSTQLNKDELVSSSTIAKAVKSLMASKQGEEIRKRAEKLGSVIRQAVKAGGISRLELDSFIAHITSKDTAVC
ncbi:zeatin O-glucosyltransferase-like [Diospyros lotus]|uniref:zeatin O-glucosyltransferase-like n=1 Tax=Diospyros lotus TaxID=55363 RepID=UPI0022558A5B|nr:zeatin O-glucosyltransferase-like [Diospyros lotus]